MTDTANGEGRNWQPLLEGETAVEALAVVHEIVEAIALQPRSQQQGLQGDASLALLLAHCRHPAAYHKLDLALSTAATASLSLSLFSGVSGLLWLLHRVGAGAEADPHRIATTMTGRTALRPPRRGLALPGKRLPHDRSRCGASVPTHSTRQIGSRSARRFAVIAVASAGGPPTPGTRQGGAIRSQLQSLQRPRNSQPDAVACALGIGSLLVAVNPAVDRVPEFVATATATDHAVRSARCGKRTIAGVASAGYRWLVE